MHDLATIATSQQPAPTADRHLERVTGKVRTALDAMVWQGLPRAKAAEYAKISEHGLYKALRKPPVRAYYLAQLDVLRTSERARNIHTLADVRDTSGNQMARVAAVKALEQLDDSPQSSASRQQTPGFVINVIAAPMMPHHREIVANRADPPAEAGGEK